MQQRHLQQLVFDSLSTLAQLCIVLRHLDCTQETTSLPLEPKSPLRPPFLPLTMTQHAIPLVDIPIDSLLNNEAAVKGSLVLVTGAWGDEDVHNLYSIADTPQAVLLALDVSSLSSSPRQGECCTPPGSQPCNPACNRLAAQPDAFTDYNPAPRSSWSTLTRSRWPPSWPRSRAVEGKSMPE